MKDYTDMKWKDNERGRRVTDRDRVLSDEEAIEYDAYIKPIMHERAKAVIEKYNAIELALDPEVRQQREKSNANYKYQAKKRRLKV
jgi:hypothetical protein